MEEDDPSETALPLPSPTPHFATSFSSTLGRSTSLPEAAIAPSTGSDNLLSRIQGTQLSPIQQSALLQALLNQRQTAHIQSRLAASAFAPGFPLGTPSPSNPLDLAFPMPFSRIDGLNELQPSLSSSTSSSLPDRLAPNQFDELINARDNLDIWASTVFQTDSPTPFFTPPILPDPSPSFHASSSSHPSQGMTVPESSFDWTTLYAQPHANVDLNTPPLHSNPIGFPVQPQLPFFTLPPLSTTPGSIEFPGHPAEPPSAAPSPRASRPSRSRRTSRAPSRQSSEGGGGGQGVETPSAAARESMTNEEIEEDKRRRNTEASG